MRKYLHPLMTVQECIVLAQARNEEEDRRSHARVFPLNIIVPCEAARKRQAPLRRKVASARVQCERVKKQRIARLSDKVYLLEAFHSKFHPFWLRSLLVPTPPFQTPTPIVSYIQRHNTRGESGRDVQGLRGIQSGHTRWQRGPDGQGGLNP